LDEHVDAFRTRELARDRLSEAAAHLDGRSWPSTPSTDVVGIFRDDRSLIRLAGMLGIDQRLS
jgi:hypothetical protein